MKTFILVILSLIVVVSLLAFFYVVVLAEVNRIVDTYYSKKNRNRGRISDLILFIRRNTLYYPFFPIIIPMWYLLRFINKIIDKVGRLYWRIYCR